MNNFTNTNIQLPPENAPIEWIGTDGKITSGTYHHKLWFLDDGMYVYYQPQFWRLKFSETN